jgi:hypothetical protein
MSKVHQVEKLEVVQPEGGDIPAQQEEQSTTSEVQEIKPVALGIGAFVRHMLKNSTKSNAEILELVLKTFPGSKTTPACIAWYKTDMRKKGLLEGAAQRGKNVVVEFTPEQLEAMSK